MPQPNSAGPKVGEVALAREAPARQSGIQPPGNWDGSRTGAAACANLSRMTKMQTAPVAGFTPGERTISVAN
jgi:hypothetical protein